LPARRPDVSREFIDLLEDYWKANGGRPPDEVVHMLAETSREAKESGRPLHLLKRYETAIETALYAIYVSQGCPERRWLGILRMPRRVDLSDTMALDVLMRRRGLSSWNMLQRDRLLLGPDFNKAAAKRLVKGALAVVLALGFWEAARGALRAEDPVRALLSLIWLPVIYVAMTGFDRVWHPLYNLHRYGMRAVTRSSEVKFMEACRYLVPQVDAAGEDGSLFHGAAECYGGVDIRRHGASKTCVVVFRPSPYFAQHLEEAARVGWALMLLPAMVLSDLGAKWGLHLDHLEVLVHDEHGALLRVGRVSMRELNDFLQHRVSRDEVHCSWQEILPETGAPLVCPDGYAVHVDREIGFAACYPMGWRVGVPEGEDASGEARVFHSPMAESDSKERKQYIVVRTFPTPPMGLGAMSDSDLIRGAKTRSDDPDWEWLSAHVTKVDGHRAVELRGKGITTLEGARVRCAAWETTMPAGNKLFVIVVCGPPQDREQLRTLHWRFTSSFHVLPSSTSTPPVQKSALGRKGIQGPSRHTPGAHIHAGTVEIAVFVEPKSKASYGEVAVWPNTQVWGAEEVILHTYPLLLESEITRLPAELQMMMLGHLRDMVIAVRDYEVTAPRKDQTTQGARRVATFKVELLASKDCSIRVARRFHKWNAEGATGLVLLETLNWALNTLAETNKYVLMILLDDAVSKWESKLPLVGPIHVDWDFDVEAVHALGASRGWRETQLAMLPSRLNQAVCLECSHENPPTSRFCNECGSASLWRR
jgi:ribosomal protein L40E